MYPEFCDTFWSNLEITFNLSDVCSLVLHWLKNNNKTCIGIVTNFKCSTRWVEMLLMHLSPSSTQLNNGAGAEESDSDQFYKPKKKRKQSLRHTGDSFQREPSHQKSPATTGKESLDCEAVTRFHARIIQCDCCRDAFWFFIVAILSNDWKPKVRNWQSDLSAVAETQFCRHSRTLFLCVFPPVDASSGRRLETSNRSTEWEQCDGQDNGHKRKE